MESYFTSTKNLFCKNFPSKMRIKMKIKFLKLKVLYLTQKVTINLLKLCKENSRMNEKCFFFLY